MDRDPRNGAITLTIRALSRHDSAFVAHQIAHKHAGGSYIIGVGNREFNVCCYGSAHPASASACSSCWLVPCASLVGVTATHLVKGIQEFS
jgi:hypothetical protein